ncbi:MAG: allophanate hydrolase [Flavobacteriaceae bacterium]|nr:allophanate hydrolase [Flavobacteriaceae bacterium]|tara:strand:+ start:20978 stop:21817 length:840 start_codon:yes stop_codon:yes gene_type:complete
MIKILEPGLYSSIQDKGRDNFQKYGVPISGCMDVKSSNFANFLLNNPENAALIEATQFGPKILFNVPTYISITGADMNPSINNKKVLMNKAINIHKGDVLNLGNSKNGLRSYIAVKDGIKSDLMLGSRSFYHGISPKFKLEKGDEYLITSIYKKLNTLSKINLKANYKNKSLSVFKGPEFKYLSENEKNFLLKNYFRISNENNRMAYKLKEKLKNKLKSIITSPVLPGTIQLTPGGEIIILMKDSQVTGGYPRIFQLKEESINLIAQKKVNDVIKFKII